MSLKERIIIITKIGEVDSPTISYLREELIEQLKTFDLSVKINSERLKIDPNELNPRRNQYDGSRILNRIKKSSSQVDFFRILGIINEDIFVTGLNFIFGLAMKPQKPIIRFPAVALISIARLREFNLERSNNEILLKRTLKEALHELGHTFGLDHCQNYCVMRFSNSISETDNKPAKYCTHCSKQLSEVLSS